MSYVIHKLYKMMKMYSSYILCLVKNDVFIF